MNDSPDGVTLMACICIVQNQIWECYNVQVNGTTSVSAHCSLEKGNKAHDTVGECYRTATRYEFPMTGLSRGLLWRVFGARGRKSPRTNRMCLHIESI